MKYPKLNQQQTTRDVIDVFKGYNHNLRIGTGEFYDMQNLTSADFPVLSPRAKRGIYAEPDTAQGLISKDSLCWVDGADFIIGEDRIHLGLSIDDTPKNLISMGAYVIIMPDKKYVNTADLDDYGDIEASVTTDTTVTFSLCKNDGTAYGNIPAQDYEPSNPANMALWIDTSSTPHVLKQYSSTTNTWVTVATTYIKISAMGIGKPFLADDGVTIEGIEDSALADLNSTMIVWDRGDDYIIVTGIIDKVTMQETPITITRRMPNMDYMTESENRLWGCRYGTDIHGNMVNEIYASKLGDFKNWDSFMGISTDSYAATVGTDGQFTGAITHLGYPLFFKETCVHKVYGSFPSNYQIRTTACRGVQNGCSKSLAIVNEILYYKSRYAVCSYDGSLPVEMSAALGDISYSDATSGALGNKYYISMKDSSEKYHLFVYDTSKGMWHKEDNLHVKDFCSCRGDLFFIDYADKKIKSINGNGTEEPGGVKWIAETGLIGTDSPDKKYISRLDIRMSLDIGSMVDVYVQYDSMGSWEHLFVMMGTNLRSFSVPIRPRRCDHLKLKIEGKGEAKMFSICKTIEQGSDI